MQFNFCGIRNGAFLFGCSRVVLARNVSCAKPHPAIPAPLPDAKNYFIAGVGMASVHIVNASHGHGIVQQESDMFVSDL